MAESNYKWYVLRAISGKENKVKEEIEKALVSSSIFKEYVSQVLIPTEKVIVQKANNKRAIKERNKLPGYVLVECILNDESYPLLRNIPNVLGFLSEGRNTKTAVPVTQDEINRMIGSAEDVDLTLQMEETFEVDEKVKVVDGPFSGFNGVVREVLQDKHKLKVSVTIFDRETPLELSFGQVEKE